ncbi:YkgJ family cysteine cluster protein [Desulfosoma caldarium]|uniref:Putative zinc-or iron-chelating protein n=1 Tax=Desulfosoma caldarium TaxID=610254 RepID=A0A3N1VJI8_9BACT|nr:YkgJ family cysteine cluster protein [Desulfosoma caldarium]ROR02963.1 putative zinc- or iron-chelating protein [Desulfosoma caldarium]
MTSPWPRDRFDERFRELEALYDAFQNTAASFVADAACKPGCADCCTNVGEIFTTTLEALRIREAMEALSIFEATDLRQRIAENREQKKRCLLLPCPFLNPDKRCRIYAVRPFSCRRLYSVEPCGSKGPVVHRDLWALAEDFTRALQALDPLGYSGHVTYVLALFDDPRFTENYLAQRPCSKALEGLVRTYDLVAHAI